MLILLVMAVMASDSDFSILDTKIGQDGSTWIIQYELLYSGPSAFEVDHPEASEMIVIEYEAEVSNSRIPSHSFPKKLKRKLIVGEKNNIPVYKKEDVSCSEEITVEAEPKTVLPGGRLFLKIFIDHAHTSYQYFYPLLGSRKFTFKIKGCEVSDVLTFDKANEELEPLELSKISKDRLSQDYFRSPPDSLYIFCHISGFNYFRFEDTLVPPRSRWRVSFWHFVAIGTEGECHARIKQYLDYEERATGAQKWATYEDCFDEILSVQGQWQKFEKIIEIGKNTTTIALDFRIVGANVGEMWIDDITIEPVPKPKRRSP